MAIFEKFNEAWESRNIDKLTGSSKFNSLKIILLVYCKLCG